MNSKKMYWLLSGSIMVLILVFIGSAFTINSMLHKESSKLVNNKAKLATVRQEQTELTKAKQDIKKYNELYKVARTVVPQNKDQAQAVRQIVKLAQENNITLSSITFVNSTLGDKAAASSTSAKPSAAAGTGTVPTGPSPTLSQLKPVPQISGVYSLEIGVESSTEPNQLTTYPALINFLSALEQNRLTALVSTIDITPANTEAGQLSRNYFSVNLTLNIYIKPEKK